MQNENVYICVPNWAILYKLDSKNSKDLLTFILIVKRKRKTDILKTADFTFLQILHTLAQMFNCLRLSSLATFLICGKLKQSVLYSIEKHPTVILEKTWLIDYIQLVAWVRYILSESVDQLFNKNYDWICSSPRLIYSIFRVLIKFSCQHNKSFLQMVWLRRAWAVVHNFFPNCPRNNNNNKWFSYCHWSVSNH